MSEVLPSVWYAAKSARPPIPESTPFRIAKEIPFGLFSNLKRRAISSAIQTGSAPIAKRNCIVSGGISREPTFDTSAHPPQEITHRMEYQNHRALRVLPIAIGRSPPYSDWTLTN
jgi:hypothetical protein